MLVKSHTLPTKKLLQSGQSPWLDYLSRDMMASGQLKRLITTQGLMGLTSNPSIFQKAISQSGGKYDADIKKLAKQGISTLGIYDQLTITDIQRACDLFSGVYKKTNGEHGYVSLEVLPNLAYQTARTVSEAVRLFKAVNRPNVMIKIPATQEGVKAVTEVIAQGINVNVTLIFSIDHYRQVAWAYIEGLERLKARGGDPSKLRSVASVFVSRIDTYVDKKLAELDSKEVQGLAGKAAVSNSKQIYQEFENIFSSKRFKKLAIQGAHIQKVLWGSTSVKNPRYYDLMYVDTLVGRDTVNTMPQETLDALLDHGNIAPDTILEGRDQAHQVIHQLSQLGIDLIEVGNLLQQQGVTLFVDAFESLMVTLETARNRNIKTQNKNLLPKDGYYFSGLDEQQIAKILADYENKGHLDRFLKQDPTLWSNHEMHIKSISNRLGWMRTHEWVTGKFYELDQLAHDVKSEKIKDILLLGMGGSSLSPEVMSLILPRSHRSIRFRIVDTTDPDSILRIHRSLNYKKTLIIVASKSGSTIETLSQFNYFYDEVSKAYGKKASAEEIGARFIAITDQGSLLQRTAQQNKFRACFINPSNIGGRFSALSLFGLVPAAAMGADFRLLVNRAHQVFLNLQAEKTLQNNSGFKLGAALGYFAKKGNDKLSLVMSAKLASFGSWLEQLIAESTGKDKTGILPIDTETFNDLEELSRDRLYVIIRLKGEKDESLARRLGIIKKAKFPHVIIEWPDVFSLGAEFYRWEVVTAISCLAFGTNPFDELNVTESKEITGRLLSELKTTKKIQLPNDMVSFTKFNFDEFMQSIPEGSYVALLAYVERTAEMQEVFQKIRYLLRKKYRVPVLLGFGPRYLHSIGQFYKGGTPKGYFIEFIKRPLAMVKVPQSHYTFSDLIQAQAAGDYLAIKNKALPIRMIDCGKEPLKALRNIAARIV